MLRLELRQWDYNVRFLDDPRPVKLALTSARFCIYLARGLLRDFDEHCGWVVAPVFVTPPPPPPFRQLSLSSTVVLFCCFPATSFSL